MKLCGKPFSVIEFVDNDTVGRMPVPLTLVAKVKVGVLDVLNMFRDVAVNVEVSKTRVGAPASDCPRLVVVVERVAYGSVAVLLLSKPPF